MTKNSDENATVQNEISLDMWKAMQVILLLIPLALLGLVVALAGPAASSVVPALPPDCSVESSPTPTPLPIPTIPVGRVSAAH